MTYKRNTKFILELAASRISLFILGGLTIWLGISAAKEAYRKHEFRGEIARLEAEKKALEFKNEETAALLDSLKDEGTLELEVKRRLNLKKIGEEVAVILRDKNDAAQYESASLEKNKVVGYEKTSTLSNPLKWWQYVTGSK